jgi:hypothetical protein
MTTAYINGHMIEVEPAAITRVVTLRASSISRDPLV